MVAMYINEDTGEVQEVKQEAAELACKLLDEVWAEVLEAYPVGAVTALGIAHKICGAVLTGALKEHADILGEDLKPKQNRLDGM